MQLYVDGRLGEEKKASKASLTAPDKLSVGIIQTGVHDSYYKGWMADLQIWNRALSANEVLATYKDKRCPDYLAPGLVASYVFSY